MTKGLEMVQFPWVLQDRAPKSRNPERASPDPGD